MKQEKKLHNINEEITSQKVRLINANGDMVGVVLLTQALEESFRDNLDLVEISSGEKETVCKIMDYNKFIYQNKKNKKSNQVKQKEEKEIKFRPVTDVADLMTKVNKIRVMLKEGHSVKLNVVFKNREVFNMKELGNNIISDVLSKISDISKIKKEPVLMGKNIIAVVEPNN